MEKVDLSKVSVEQLEELIEQKKEEKRLAALVRREAYEGLRNELLDKIEHEVRGLGKRIDVFHGMVVRESGAFHSIMNEYGQLRNGDAQMNYKIRNGRFMIEVRTNKVKKFDERADVAAKRLIDFLQKWIKSSEKGTEDAMYQLTMTLLERNRYGDLDYKSISKLYDFEDRFGDDEYSEIMRLFKESTIVEGTATNFYFYEKTELGVWKKIEVSFNRL
jgi:hypothetical protein